MRPRATSISSNLEHSLPGEAQRNGSYIANGVLHPGHMAEPGEEGYRTPTGEDFEHAHGLRHRLLERLHHCYHNYEADQRTLAGRNRASIGDAVFEEEGERDGDGADPSASSVNSKVEGQEDNHHHHRWKVSAHRHRWKQSKQLECAEAATQQTDDVEFLDWRQRLKHFTWTFFTITMATGGIANVIWHVPFHFTGRYTIGCVFFLLNVLLFFINVVCISLRFYFYPHTFRNSFLHPTESLFVPAAVVSFGTILMNISQYGTDHVGPWLNTVVMVLFWVDAGLAFVASFGTYLLFWSTQTFTIALMTPVWIFPAYPLLIIGPHAAVLSSTLLPERSAKILVGGFTFQGIGMMVSMMIYSAYIYRLMTQKLPLERLRPGMFVSVGPSAFTASGLTNMASNAARTWAGTDFMGNGDLAAIILRIIGDWTALWFWGLSLWFFCIAVGAHYAICTGKKSFPFAMTWFSFVFPQTALVNSTFAVAGAFDLFPLKVIGCVMAAALVAMWFFVVIMMIKAICLKQILWPQKGEDKDEGGFKDNKTSADDALTRRRTNDASEKV